MYRYKTQGTCSKYIDIDVREGVIHEVKFSKGCAGNTAGIERLVRGQSVERVVELLRGIQCQNQTSCPDQLARALIEMRGS